MVPRAVQNVVSHPHHQREAALGEHDDRHLDGPDIERTDRRIVSVAVTIVVDVNSDGRRAVLGMAIGCSDAKAFWTDCLPTLTRRGPRGVISDVHEGLKAAMTLAPRAKTPGDEDREIRRPASR